jgi:LPPG:FO 2-phospho-L-lactate transferase
MTDERVVLLTGGTGGAKLAAGMAQALPEGALTAIANTGDDIEIYGAYVSPDPDLVCFWLGGLIDERGWGLRGDTFAVMDGLRALGRDVWFNLGDRDLAWCMERSRMLADGATHGEALAALGGHIGLSARVLPMCEQPVRTWVSAGEDSDPIPFQEYMIRRRAVGPVHDVQFRGARQARPSEEVLRALKGASAIVIGPSNPIVSIGPILAVPGMREALAASPAPVVAVSPIVGGEVLKGPTADFMSHAGLPLSAAGVARCYEPLLDGIVADEPVGGLQLRQTDTAMPDAGARLRLAREVIAFARSLG